MRFGRTVSRPCPGRGVHRRRQSRMFLIPGLVLCCLGSTQIAAAGINTWTSVGPEGGAIVEAVVAVVIDPTRPTVTTLYAATLDGGVFKSTDGDGRWTTANTGLTVPSVRTLAIDPTTPSILYAGTAGDGVFKSTDGGGNWSAVFDSWGAAVQGLAIDSRNVPATTIYAGTHGYGVFKSTEGGDSWNPVNTGMIDDSGACYFYGYNCYAFVGDVTIDPQTPDILYAEAWTADTGFQQLTSFVFKS